MLQHTHKKSANPTKPKLTSAGTSDTSPSTRLRLLPDSCLAGVAAAGAWPASPARLLAACCSSSRMPLGDPRATCSSADTVQCPSWCSMDPQSGQGCASLSLPSSSLSMKVGSTCSARSMEKELTFMRLSHEGREGQSGLLSCVSMMLAVTLMLRMSSRVRASSSGETRSVLLSRMVSAKAIWLTASSTVVLVLSTVRCCGTGWLCRVVKCVGGDVLQ